jgi:iron complex transport system ATP-binding protein
MIRLRLADLDLAIDGHPIVTGADLEVAPGEMVGLVGPNGSGKSTLLRAVYRMVRPAAGRVLLDDDDAWQLPSREVARRAAVVVQEPPSDFDFTAREVVAMGRLPYKGLLDRDTAADAGLVADALAQVGLAEVGDRPFATLSGGEKQRVLVARALAQQSRLLVLDEPTNHLDVRYQLEVLDLVAQLGITTLVALHDLNLAASYCQRVYVLQDGAVVVGGAPDEVLTPSLVLRVFGVWADRWVHPATGRAQLAFSSPPASEPVTPSPNGREEVSR